MISGVLAQIADRVGVMYAGHMVEMAPTTRLFAEPRHPYTRGLIASVPQIDEPARPSPAAAARPVAPPGAAGGLPLRAALRSRQPRMRERTAEAGSLAMVMQWPAGVGRTRPSRQAGGSDSRRGRRGRHARAAARARQHRLWERTGWLGKAVSGPPAAAVVDV